MNYTDNVLHQAGHRPYPMPSQNWKYYQEWHEVIFAHWKVPATELNALLPAELELDLFDGLAWVSMVAFTIKKLKPHYLPAFSPVSDFEEINMRTYVKKNGKQGIYFLSVEASKKSSAFLASMATGLPYIRSEIVRRYNSFKSSNDRLNYYMNIEYEPLQKKYKKDSLDRWLTERYCIFQKINGKFFSYEVHHAEWPLKEAAIHSFKINYEFGNMKFKDIPASRYHYSKGINVLTWSKRTIT